MTFLHEIARYLQYIHPTNESNLEYIKKYYKLTRKRPTRDFNRDFITQNI